MRSVRALRPARSLAALALAGALATLSACGSDTSTATDDVTDSGSTPASSSSASPSPTSSASGTTIDITIKGDTIDPAGKRVQVAKGEPVTLHITADKAGELHVHSSPEQHIEFKAGETTAQVVIKQPGLVDVEDHALEKLIVQLEVR